MIYNYGIIDFNNGGTYGIVKITNTIIQDNNLNSNPVFEGLRASILVAEDVILDVMSTHGPVTVNNYTISNEVNETTYIFYESGLCEAIIPFPKRTTPPMTPVPTSPQETQQPTNEIPPGNQQDSSEGSKLILGFLTHKQFYICIGIVCGLILIILVLIFVIHRLRNKAETNSLSEYSYSMQEETVQHTDPFNSTVSNTHDNPLFVQTEDNHENNENDDAFANDFEDVNFSDFNSDSKHDKEDSDPKQTIELNIKQEDAELENPQESD